MMNTTDTKTAAARSLATAGRKGRESSLKFENDFTKEVNKEFGIRACIKAAESSCGKGLGYPSTLGGSITTKPDNIIFLDQSSEFSAAKEFQRIYDIELHQPASERLFSKSAKLNTLLEDRSKFAPLSLKAPGSPSVPIQMQVTSLANFNNAARHHLTAHPSAPATDFVSMSDFSDYHRALELWIGVPRDEEKNIYKESHREMLQESSISYDSLTQFEKDKGRLYSHTLPEENLQAFKKLLNRPSLRHSMATVVFSIGITSKEDIENHPELRADYMVWRPKDGTKTTVFSIPDVIKAVVESELVINPTTVYLGPLQFQKKGSGTGSAYNNIQFNSSLNGMLDHVTPIYEGDAAGAYLKIKEHTLYCSPLGEGGSRRALSEKYRLFKSA